jgi:hypothetical protein
LRPKITQTIHSINMSPSKSDQDRERDLNLSERQNVCYI